MKPNRTLAPIFSRLKRGFGRVLAYLRIGADRLRKRRPATASHADTARETGVMLGLMAQANAAGPAMTDEQRLLLIQAAPGMRAREAKLLAIPNRSSVEENELHMIRREMAAIEGRTAPQQPSRIRALLGPMAAGAPWLAILGSPLTWIAAGLAAFGVQTVRIERLHHDLDAARHDVATAVRNREQWQHAYAEQGHLLEEARQASTQTSENLNRLERQRAAAAAAERKRQHDAQNMLSGVGDPPDFGLHDSGASASSSEQPAPAASAPRS